MFTGLVEAVGKITAVRRLAGSSRISVATPWSSRDVALGDSISVDGVCLTVAGASAKTLEFDAVAETLSRTTLGTARPGRRVNLERALRADGRLGGHFVQGHVDDVAPTAGLSGRTGDRRLRVRMTAGIRRFIAEKGSITLNGVSLTVSGRDRAGFEVALIPETLARTNLGDLRPGDRVHVEVDRIARYLDVLLRARRGA